MSKRKRDGNESDPCAAKHLPDYFDKKQKVQNATSPTQNLQPTFMGIPGELRCQIYRLVLVETEKDCSDMSALIQVHNSQHTEPPLLHTSQQIRKEAANIFYRENGFCVQIHGFEPPPRPEHWLWKTSRPPWFSCQGQFSPANFIGNWLQKYWYTRYHGTSEEGNHWYTVIDTICEDIDRDSYWDSLRLVQILGSDGVRWETIKETLEVLFDAATRYRANG